MPSCPIQFTTVGQEVVAFDRIETEVSPEGGLTVVDGALFALHRTGTSLEWTSIAKLPGLDGEKVEYVHPVAEDVVVVTASHLLRYRVHPGTATLVGRHRIRGEFWSASASGGSVAVESMSRGFRTSVYDAKSDRMVRYARMDPGFGVGRATPEYLVLYANPTLFHYKDGGRRPPWMELGNIGMVQDVPVRRRIRGLCGDWVLDDQGFLNWPSVQNWEMQVLDVPPIPGMDRDDCDADKTYTPSKKLAESLACVVHGGNRIFTVDRQGGVTEVERVEITSPGPFELPSAL